MRRILTALAIAFAVAAAALFIYDLRDRHPERPEPGQIVR
jgi:hypothetical protein